jgi:hypothetical protein
MRGFQTFLSCGADKCRRLVSVTIDTWHHDLWITEKFASCAYRRNSGLGSSRETTSVNERMARLIAT